METSPASISTADLAARYHALAPDHRRDDFGLEAVALAQFLQRSPRHRPRACRNESSRPPARPAPSVCPPESRERNPPAQARRSSGVNGRIRISSIPCSRIIRARSSSVVSKRGALAGATSLAGCGSNVSTADFQPSSRASADTRRKICRWPAMHAVEIADRDGARTEIVRRLGQTPINHAAAFSSTSISSPSYASRTCGGKRSSVQACPRS